MSLSEKAGIFRALGHSDRIGVMGLIGAKGAMSAKDYCSRTKRDKDLGAVSHHFRRLKAAGLIEVAKTEQCRGALKKSYKLTPLGRQVLAWVKRLN